MINKYKSNFRELLWKFNIISVCPICGKKLTEFGYSDFGHYYRCDFCGWGLNSL